MIIYLGASSPKPSSDLPESRPGRSSLSVWSCSGWGLHSPSRYRAGGSLLHCHSTLPPVYCFAKHLKPLHGFAHRFTKTGAVLFLLHWPWSRLHRTLSGILPYGARTFLVCTLSSVQPRSFVLLIPFVNQTSKQLPPTNSLHREFFGSSSLLIPRKYSRNLSRRFAS